MLQLIFNIEAFIQQVSAGWVGCVSLLLMGFVSVVPVFGTHTRLVVILPSSGYFKIHTWVILCVSKGEVRCWWLCELKHF